VNVKPILTPALSDYRQHLVDAEQKSQESFDTTVLSLSGGALGISFVFLKDVIGSSPVQRPIFLLSAWMFWAASSLAVLMSFYLSHLALRRAIRQVDDGTIYAQRAGGVLSVVTAILNAIGAITFVAGVIGITVFASANLSSKETTRAREETTVATAAPSAPVTATKEPAQHTASPGNTHP
jgi:hypothetical protein